MQNNNWVLKDTEYKEYWIENYIVHGETYSAFTKNIYGARRFKRKPKERKTNTGHYIPILMREAIKL